MLVAVALVAGGCARRAPVAFDSPDPARRIDAAVRAVEHDDRTAVPHLIDMLDSTDPATRFVAIHALERLTGQTMGYDYASPEPDRDAAVDQWTEWYHSRTEAEPPRE